MPRRTLQILASVTLLAAAPAYAGPGDYRVETGFEVEHQEFDDVRFPVVPGIPGLPAQEVVFTPPDINTYRLEGRFFFTPVKTDDVPLAEAAYLGRVSSAIAAWERAHIQGMGDFDLQQLGVDVYVPNTMFFFAAGVARFEANGEDDTDWYAVAGITPFDGLRITTIYNQNGGYDPNIAVKYVGKIRGRNFYGAGLRVSDPDLGDLSIGVNFDYYFDHTFSLGAAYDEGPNRKTLSATKFFLPALSVSGSLFDQDDGKGANARVAYRF